MPRLTAVVVSMLLAVSLSAQTIKLVVHLQLTDSVNQSLAAGRITKILVSGNCGGANFSATVRDRTAVAPDVAPGTCREHTLFLMNGTYYMVDERTLDVPSLPSFDTTLDIPAVVVAGRVTNHGEPVHGQMNLFPSEHHPGNWGFAVPFDKDGRFEFPLPKPGQWDLDISDSPTHHLAKLRGVEFKTTTNDFEIATSPAR